ncbi:MAG TPA: hypothetical protein ENH01_11415 [Nitrospirae bacterium]|nr:hypothetical protein [Nitrospirota bacterium]
MRACNCNYLKEIFKTGELVENSVIRKIRTTAADGKKYLTSFYSLDTIIAVGYRVNSCQATQFQHLGHPLAHMIPV